MTSAREFFTFAELLRRVDETIDYLRSFFDDPVAGGKGSVARLCAFLAMVTAVIVAVATVRFAFTHDDKVGMAGVLAGVLTTLLGTGVLGLLLRKKGDGSTEPDDDRPAPAQTVTTATETTVQTGGS